MYESHDVELVRGGDVHFFLNGSVDAKNTTFGTSKLNFLHKNLRKQHSLHKAFVKHGKKRKKYTFYMEMNILQF